MIEFDRAKRARIAGSLALLLGVFVPIAAYGQGADPPRSLAAQALYEQATAEMDAGKYPSACHKLEEVTRIVPEGLGARLTLAQCYEALGKRASAWAQYVQVESQAANAGQAERSKTAGEKAAALRPKLATLSIEVPDDVRSIPGLAITRDGVLLGDAQWGLPLPVDAGAHEVTATAPGRKTQKIPVDVPGDGAKKVVRLEPLDVDPNATLGSAAPKAPALSEAPATSPAPQRTWQRPLGLGAIALGGAGIAAGAVFGGLALSKKGQSNADNHCDALNRCDDSGLSLRKEAVGLGNGSTAALAAGAVILAGGVVLFATAPSGTVKDEHAGVSDGTRGGQFNARVELLPGGMSVKGSW